MFVVTRPVNGISLNGDEFLLAGPNEIKTFESEEAAKEFLAENEIMESDYDHIGLKIVPYNP